LELGNIDLRGELIHTSRSLAATGDHVCCPPSCRRQDLATWDTQQLAVRAALVLAVAVELWQSESPESAQVLPTSARLPELAFWEPLPNFRQGSAEQLKLVARLPIQHLKVLRHRDAVLGRVGRTKTARPPVVRVSARWIAGRPHESHIDSLAFPEFLAEVELAHVVS